STRSFLNLTRVAPDWFSPHISAVQGQTWATQSLWILSATFMWPEQPPPLTSQRLMRCSRPLQQERGLTHSLRNSTLPVPLLLIPHIWQEAAAIRLMDLNRMLTEICTSPGLHTPETFQR